tara:strand:+ start:129 stop:1406 length:1278 start_codon:yes stop_codon:yes gene_type:complete
MAQMTPAQRFLMMTQGRQPRPVANMMRQYQTPAGITPRMALQRPQPPAPAMPAAPRLSPMMQRVAQQAAMPRMTPPVAGAGAATSPATTTPAGGQPSGFMGAFSQPLTSPVGQAISQAAIAGARASDYSPTPVSLGRVLAEMGAAASQGYAAGEDRLAKQQAANLQKEYTEAKIAEMSTPKQTALVQNLIAAGLKPGTQAFQDALLAAATKPSTVFMGGDKQKEAAYNAALQTRKDMVKQVNADRELGVRLETAIDLLESGVQTGRVQAAMMPLKQISREIGFLSDEDISDLSDQEIIDSVTAYLTPRMRVTGAGASSDRDMDFFQRSTVRMANTPEANLVIAKMQKQVMDYNKNRLDLFDDYVKEKGDDFGFGKFADGKMGSPYQRASTDDELSKLIDSGKIKEGDVFFNGITNEFDILTRDMM